MCRESGRVGVGVGGGGRERGRSGGLVKWFDLNGRFLSKCGEWLSKKKKKNYHKKKKKPGIQSAEGLAGLPLNPRCALQRLVPVVELPGRPGALHKYSRGRPAEISERKRVRFSQLLNFNPLPLQTRETGLKCSFHEKHPSVRSSVHHLTTLRVAGSAGDDPSLFRVLAKFVTWPQGHFRCCPLVQFAGVWTAVAGLANGPAGVGVGEWNSQPSSSLSSFFFPGQIFAL